MSQLGNLSGDEPFTELGDGNAGWWTRARLARKGTEPVGTSIGQQGTKGTPIRLTKGRIAKAPVIKVWAGFKGQRDVKLPENGVGRPAPPQCQKVRGSMNYLSHKE